jgi:hypothetical protein
MSGKLTERLAPPRDLRPAQLGIILIGRVIVGHLGATLADLCARGFLRIEEVPDDDGAQWLLTDLRGQDPSPGVPPLPFEMTLLDGLFGPQARVRLVGIGGELVPALNRVRAELGRDAIRNGWLRRWRRDQRTEQGEQLFRQIQGFRQELRARALSGAETAAHQDMATRPYPEIPWERLEAFTQTWQSYVNAAGANSGNGRPGDFARQWSTLPGHDHANPGHQSGYDGYGGGSDSGNGFGGFGI